MSPDNNWCSQCGRTDDKEVDLLRELLRDAVYFGVLAAEAVLEKTNNFSWKPVINRLRAIASAVDG